MPKVVRDYVLSVRLSSEERSKLKYLADSCRCSESDLIRKLIQIFSSK